MSRQKTEGLCPAPEMGTFMNVRSAVFQSILNRRQSAEIQEKGEFGRLTFHSGIFEKLLKSPVSSHLKEAIAGRVQLKTEFLQNIAEAMQQWAIGLNATHFCHWFQPLTGHSAEKQDAFLSWDMRGKPIQEFTGKQ